jgi:hypothetical protein
MPTQSKPSGFLSPSSSPATFDAVTISPNEVEFKITDYQHGPSKTLDTLTLPTLHLTVLDFSMLLEVVKSHAPFYTVNEYQCCWYAGLTFKVIKLEYNATETINTSTKLEHVRCKGSPLKKVDAALALQEDLKVRKDLDEKSMKFSKGPMKCLL